MASNQELYEVLIEQLKLIHNHTINTDLLSQFKESTEKSQVEIIKEIAIQIREYSYYLIIKGNNPCTIEKTNDSKSSFEFKSPTKLTDPMIYYAAILPYHYNYFLTQTDTRAFLDNFKDKKDAELALLFNPFSVNFFNQSFTEILTSDLANPSASSDPRDHAVPIIISKLEANMHLCPASLYEFLKQLNPDQFSQVLNRIFEENSPIFPFLQKIIDHFKLVDTFQVTFIDQLKSNIFSQSNTKSVLPYLDPATLRPLKDVYDTMISDFLTHQTLKKPQNLKIYVCKPEITPKKAAAQPSSATKPLYNLLLLSPRLPTKLPQSLQQKSFLEIIKALLVREGPRYFQRITNYEKLAKDFHVTTKEDILKQIGFESPQNNLQKLTETTKLLEDIKEYVTNALDTYRSAYNLLTLRQDTKVQEYLQEPKTFKIADPNYLNCRAYYQLIKFSEFLMERPGLSISDNSFKTSMETLSNQYLSNKKTQHFCQTIRNLTRSGMQNFGTFSNHAYNFISAFTSDTDPFTKCQEIWKHYNKLKSSIMLRADSNTKMLINCNSRLFDLTVFFAICPPNFASVYVYLNDYLMNHLKVLPKGDPAFGNIERTKELFRIIITNTLSRSSDILSLCRLSLSKAEIDISPSPENIDHIAGFMVGDFAMFKTSEPNPEEKALNIKFLQQQLKTKDKVTVSIRILKKISLKILTFDIILNKNSNNGFIIPAEREDLLRLY